MNITGFPSQMTAVNAGAGEPITWIAAVHHHPLPLPYDDGTERMMIMDNAGALMKELSRAGIRLVLHGHKHHQHFARIVVDPAASHSSELAVLSAGTPTHAPSEFLNFEMPRDVALEEVCIHVQFPHEISLPYRIDAKQRAAGASDWDVLPRDCVVRIESARSSDPPDLGAEGQHVSDQ